MIYAMDAPGLLLQTKVISSYAVKDILIIAPSMARRQVFLYKITDILEELEQ
jgi:hypothetical protein